MTKTINADLDDVNDVIYPGKHARVNRFLNIGGMSAAEVEGISAAAYTGDTTANTSTLQAGIMPVPASVSTGLPGNKLDTSTRGAIAAPSIDSTAGVSVASPALVDTNFTIANGNQPNPSAVDGVYATTPVAAQVVPATSNNGSIVLISGIILAAIGLIAGVVMHFKEHSAAA